MLCTRIRLAERRFSITRDSTEVGNGTGIVSAPSSGIVQRPCVLRNLATNCGSVSTPRTARRTNKNEKSKPPLVVFNVNMQPGTKTLAQSDVKRDPRRLPTYCENYKPPKRELQPDEKFGDLIVRGVELLGDHTNNGPDSTEDESPSPRNELKIELTECCQCMREDIHMHRDTPIIQMINEDGNLLTVDTHTGDYHNINRTYHSRSRAPPSPRTRQVIRITMNSKKNG